MSKIKLEGNASGTGTLTISAPSTNTDRSLTLPDGAGEILTDASTLSSSNLSGALPAIDGSALTGMGINEIDSYRINSNFSVPTAYAWSDVNNYWEREDVSGDALSNLGTGMSESAGVFTFPSTGHWLVIAHAQFYGGASSSTNALRFLNTINNSNYDDACSSYTDSQNTTGTNRSISMSMIIDVTSTSLVKTKLQVYAYNTSVSLIGNTGNNKTYINFIRLTDT